MRKLLKLHPDSRCAAVTHIEAELARRGANNLVVSYFVTGRIGDVCLPPVATVTRKDELWRHTCFEAFVRAAPEAEYYEFNFAPSKNWAAYRYSSYRSGMCVASEIRARQIDVQAGPGSYTLQATLELDDVPRLPDTASWHVGLSALIEDMSGGKSYWALAHPAGKPDFHHAEAFAHVFSPAVAS